jgi:hypothetical protein
MLNADLCIEMKYLIAALYSNWTTHIVDDQGIEQKDIYTAPPKSGSLLVTLKPTPWLAVGEMADWE